TRRAIRRRRHETLTPARGRAPLRRRVHDARTPHGPRPGPLRLSRRLPPARTRPGRWVRTRLPQPEGRLGEVRRGPARAGDALAERTEGARSRAGRRPAAAD